MAMRVKAEGKFLLSMKQQQRAAAVITLCSGVEKRYGEVTKDCHAHFAAEFPSTAHIKQVEHYRAFGNELRKGSKFAYNLFVVWVRVKLYGVNKDTGKPKAGPLPGRKGAGKGKAFSIGQYAVGFASRCEAFADSVANLRKAKLDVNASVLSKVTAALKAMQDANDAIQAAAEDAAEAREENEAQAA